MDDHPGKSPDHLTINVTHRDDPLFEVAEADALAALRKYPDIVVRGPLFGLAEQRPGDRPRWRLIGELENGAPQLARDELNSHLWFKAKDETDDPAVRRSLLAAVARLETAPVNEVSAAGTRYRVVRADEFARIGGGRLEPPRPTDPDSESWDPKTVDPSRSDGFVIDHAAAVGLSEGIGRANLLSLAYTAGHYPKDVRADSEKALTSHPGVVLLPPTFRVVERKEGSWGLVTGLHPTPQDARRALVYHLKVYLPEMVGIDPKEAAVYAKAADRFAQRKRPDELLVRGKRFDLVRVERMVRIGPNGPETPRPSDVDEYEPSKMHPTMDEHGVITYDE
ncbi:MULTISPECIES: DUF5954 family protein [Streptomyces]|uniref:DUF5954 family protein n=1 Tax=Streptomyces TaxID=1883 RepID=UPI0015C439D7|nr:MULTISPECIES: DUF5954 family protein [Streptomyces]MBK0376626.1 hypothetical protein [Streptomyces sp. RB110-1]MBK0387000.1 hypothetical protein [Streptomyces sp. RB110-2]MCF3167203.1 hypothetical protein [Streptomyces violaceoruber]MDW4900452.1 DUF5954 family protein [Streptomyces californicus]QLG34164.1 hypothetical protein HXS80_22705 [Streptomyces sp. CB04723]